MGAYVARRFAGSLVVLFCALGVIFLLTRLAPGSPAASILGVEAADPASVSALNHSMGLDLPLPLQYLDFLRRSAQGDFGTSYYTHRPAVISVLERVPVTLELAGLTIVVSVLVSGFLALIAASRRNSKVDGGLRVVTLLAISIPNFWLGLLLILFFGLYVPGILPPSGWVDFTTDPIGNLQHCLLPVIVLSLPTIAVLFRSLRVSLLDVLNRDYVTYGHAMGLSEGRVLRRVALPNAVIPTATVAGLVLGYLIGGSLIVETVFSIPGLGNLVVYAFSKRDFPVATGAVLFVAVGFITINFLVDVAYAYFSPRIRDLYSRKTSLAEM
jgi:peptide/nickel transport system permease protein